eukprot:644597-Pelagomonas_calceolata.AAC.7
MAWIYKTHFQQIVTIWAPAPFIPRTPMLGFQRCPSFLCCRCVAFVQAHAPSRPSAQPVLRGIAMENCTFSSDGAARQAHCQLLSSHVLYSDQRLSVTSNEMVPEQLGDL